MTYYERGSGNPNLLLDFDGSESEVPAELVLARFDVSEIVRVPIGEYPKVAKPGQTFTHFNLQIHADVEDTKVALAKIKRHGYFIKPGKERLPLLSLQDIWLAKTTLFIPATTYEDIPKDVFASTIGNVHNANEVRQLIWNRYSYVLPAKSRFEITNQPISVRQFKLIEQVSYIS